MSDMSQMVTQMVREKDAAVGVAQQYAGLIVALLNRLSPDEAVVFSNNDLARAAGKSVKIEASTKRVRLTLSEPEHPDA